MVGPRSRRRGLSVLGVAVVFLTGCVGTDTTEVAEDAIATANEIPTASIDPMPTPPAEDDEDDRERDASDAESDSALRMLYELDVKGRAPKTGYDRDLFGWRDDVDRNGCDTRNDVLRRDLADITLQPGGCVVLAGSLTSDYTGDTFDFVRGSGNNIDIDHVVALSNAWQTGAQELSYSERIDLGNDPVNLLAVESSVNRSKGDGDAATWLPPRKSYRCEYVARQIQVKHDYDLWVTPPEFDAMEGLLLDCDQDSFGDDDWPGRGGGDVTSEPLYEPEEEPVSRTGTGTSGGGASGSGSSDAGAAESGSSGGDVHYKNCTAARDAGAAPVHAGDPGYGKHLDRDGDGIGCE